MTGADLVSDQAVVIAALRLGRKAKPSPQKPTSVRTQEAELGNADDAGGRAIGQIVDHKRRGRCKRHSPKVVREHLRICDAQKLIGRKVERCHGLC